MARSSTSGQGRKPGIPNKITRPIRELAGQHSEAAIKTLALIAGDDQQPSAARIAAIKELLDRAHGRPSATMGTQIPTGTLAEQGQAAIQAASAGKLPLDHLTAVMGALAQQARILEQDDIVRRLDSIETFLRQQTIQPPNMEPIK